MRAGLRFGMAILAAAFAFAPLPALAQETSPPATNTPATDTIGPRELENFTLNGTVTRPAPTAPAPAARPPAATPSRSATRTAEPGPAPARDRPAISAPAETSTRAPAQSAARPAADPFFDVPTPAPTAEFDAQPGFAPAPSETAGLSEDQPTDFVPWLIALILLGAGAGYYAWRQQSQSRYATAGGTANAFASPEPSPAPQPLSRAPAPRPATPPASPSGIVSTRLRPWLEIEFSPGRCVVEEDKATIQFDIAVFNSGSAPARDVLIEASMFNAGPTQDQEIGAFFAHPVAKGERIPAIPPLKRVALKSAVSLSREQMRQFEVAGRRLFVPLVGFNALYRWSGGDGQTSASYLVGRDTNGEKMAPLRLDLGPRVFRGLGARQHNVGVRR